MLEIYDALLTDLAPIGAPETLRDAVRRRDIVSIRSHEWPAAGYDSYIFKKVYQLESFFKRYIFEEDVYDDDALREKAKSDFIASQAEFGLPAVVPESVKKTLNLARTIVHGIVGEFDMDTFCQSCKWGRGAARNLPLRKSYLDERLSLISGTVTQHEYFSRVVSDDNLLAAACENAQVEVVDYVKYATVPKSYKAHRGIAPDTILGGFLSQGLGVYLRERLETETHIQLKHAQMRHKQLAQRASKTGAYATIDMSKASDSFVWDHVAWLMPNSWHEVLGVVKTDKISIDIDGGVLLPLKSYMLMGSGHTFPLQTLLFYSIAEAVRRALGARGKVHCFGDDLIVPTSTARVLVRVLEEIGFTINTEKSFLEGPFRESCGGDYHLGVDVRPFMFKGSGADSMSLNQVLSSILKIANGLLARWTEWEIPTTLHVLWKEWGKLTDRPMPQGIYGVTGDAQAINYSLANYPLEEPHRIEGTAEIQVTVLCELLKQRKPKIELPYLWSTLRAANVPNDDLCFTKPSFRPIGNRPGELAGEPFTTSEPQKGVRKRYKWKTKKLPMWFGA